MQPSKPRSVGIQNDTWPCKSAPKRASPASAPIQISASVGKRTVPIVIIEGGELRMPSGNVTITMRISGDFRIPYIASPFLHSKHRDTNVRSRRNSG